MTAADLAAILDALAERGIRPTPLNVIAHAIDVGVDEDTAVALVELIRERQEDAENCWEGADG